MDTHDPLPDIREIVRDAIDAGLVPGITPDEFEEAITGLSAEALEAYLQELWDAL